MPDRLACGSPPDGAGAGSDEQRAGLGRRSFLTAAGAGIAGVLGLSAGAAALPLGRSAGDHPPGEATVGERSGAAGVKVLWQARTQDKVMALTFDDGPGDTLTAPLLDVLREHRVRATFALLGRRAAEQRSLVRRQMRDGHELANHTWTHPDVALLSYDELTRELERTDQLLYELTGRRPAVLRPPYGRLTGDLLQYAAQSGQDILLWNVRFQESRLDSAGNAAYVLDRLRPGTVLLGHDAGSANRYIGTQAVPALVRTAKQRGYAFVTASELFALDAETSTAPGPAHSAVADTR